MRALTGMTGRVIFTVLLILLGVGHLFFSVVNFGYIDRLPENLDVMIEALGALIAAGSLFWASANQVRRRPAAAILLVGGCALLAGLVASIAGGASTPEMLLVLIPIFTASLVALVVDHGLGGRRRASASRPHG